jgi:hypothetical protein
VAGVAWVDAVLDETGRLGDHGVNRTSLSKRRGGIMDQLGTLEFALDELRGVVAALEDSQMDTATS